ncbi:MAG: dihydroneopterin aldolase family protein [Euryarchaeota archaeon]|nr:dihydroneopterin aldolase family protein [Euryarchaeota archaeon]MBV1729253.1 dihydroneopterin aldolase family protein [Methanobacterium sp.]MBU4547827.1 dihydroneopterin aldolase family protein [Euryarchaeota archaeon]MBU4606938.1 dihydroneopterin aldolase family protein [Euryarchaeota archaeon]MBV1754665.1 dihydroneopterin aldolase family protein [Methanobacterium sp.]
MDINDKDKVNEKYFSNLSSRERAIFEGAISMGALFHQFIGTPVSLKSADSLQKAIEDSIELQPGIKKIKVLINPHILVELDNEFEYTSLTGDMLDVKIHSEFQKIRALIRMKFIPELNYPLMYVESINEE